MKKLFDQALKLDRGGLFVAFFELGASHAKRGGGKVAFE